MFFSPDACTGGRGLVVGAVCGVEVFIFVLFVDEPQGDRHAALWFAHDALGPGG